MWNTLFKFLRVPPHKLPRSGGTRTLPPLEDTCRETNTEGLPMPINPVRSYPLHQQEPNSRPFLEWVKTHAGAPRPLARAPLSGPMERSREQVAQLPTGHPPQALRRKQLLPIQDNPSGFSMEQPAWLAAIIREARRVANEESSVEVWGALEQPPQTGALESLAYLATLRHDSDTLEVPTVMKMKQEEKRKREGQE